MKRTALLFPFVIASQAQAGITDNFADGNLEGNFRRNFIRELARQDIPISNAMIGGAFQFGEELMTSTVDISEHAIEKNDETLYSIPLPGNHIDFYNNFANCPSNLDGRFYFFQNKSQNGDKHKPRPAFLKGETFLIEEIEVDLEKNGEVLHYFGLCEAERDSNGTIKAIPGKRIKTFIEVTSPTRLKAWSLIVGFNNYIYPLMSKEDKDLIARSPLPEVPKEGSGKSFGGPESLMGCLVASPWSVWRVGVEAEGKSPNAAIAKYTQAIQANAKDAWSYWKRASAYRKKKEFASAIRDLGEVIKLAEAEKGAEAFAIQMRNTRAVWRIKELSTSSK